MSGAKAVGWRRVVHVTGGVGGGGGDGDGGGDGGGGGVGVIPGQPKQI